MPILNPKRHVALNGRTYVICELLGYGGSGEVYRVTQDTASYALKLFFPFYDLNLFGATGLTAKIRDSMAFQRSEHAFLLRLSHPNIVKVHDAGDLVLQQREQKRLPVNGVTTLPVLLTEYIDGSPLNDAISHFDLNADQITHLLRRLAAALHYLHDTCNYMHTDLKAANILIRKVDHEPILIDFALCKNLNSMEVDLSQPTRLIGDWDLFPKELPTDHRLKAFKTKDGTRQTLRELAFPTLDLFQVGKLIKAILSLLSGRMNDRDIVYLDTIADALTRWESAAAWTTPDLVSRFARLGEEHFSAFGVPELSAPTSTERMIMIPPSIGVPLTRRIEQIIDTRSFRRLSLIHQLCLLSLVYPGADYKRAVHVLYSYNLTRELVSHLYTSPLFRMLFDRRSAQQLLVMALLHDINHFPFLHVFQESAIPGLDRVGVVDLFCDGEATGERAARKPSIYDLLNDVGIDPPRFKRLVFSGHHEQINEIDAVISSILNSGVDIDKLSYLFLDGYFTGVRYGGGIDYPCILKAATIVRVGGDERPHLAFGDRALQATENVVMTRAWNFRSLYWHHTNRALMAMVLRVVRNLYVKHKRDVKEYLLDTMWLNDVDALKYLDQQYEKQVHQPSIVAGIVAERGKLYRRLYTVRAGFGDDVDDALYRDLRPLSLDGELELCGEIAKALRGFLRGGGDSAFEIDPDEILIDLPRRDMDSGGPVYLVRSDGKAAQLSELSEPVRSINSSYERLTKRIRIFISPRLASVINKDARKERRKEIQTLLVETLKVRGKGSTQIR
ncbi:MAG TPA: protein kinase [Planctomycetaceae bacterium]|jgi:HD superfamily phosphohydrolase|nr:protein kinase [Planctomycetaceae bacterium]